MPLPAKREGCIACCVHKEFGRAARAHVKPWVLLGNGGRDGPMISGRVHMMIAADAVVGLAGCASRSSQRDSSCAFQSKSSRQGI